MSSFFPTDIKWEKLWQLNHLLPHTTHFIWKLLHIPISDRISHKLHTPTDYCVLCKNELETTSHLFIHWSFTRALWFLLGLRPPPNFDLHALLRDLMASSSWLEFSIITCNLLSVGWQIHNDVFHGGAPSPLIAFDRSTTARNLINIFGGNRLGQANSTHAAKVARINADAAFYNKDDVSKFQSSMSNPSQVGSVTTFGRIARDEFGNILSGVVGALSRPSPPMAELYIILHALMFARYLKLNKVEIEGDCQTTFFALDGSSAASKNCRNLFGRIKALTAFFSDVSFVWIPRFPKQPAHQIANPLSSIIFHNLTKKQSIVTRNHLCTQVNGNNCRSNYKYLGDLHPLNWFKKARAYVEVLEKKKLPCFPNFIYTTAPQQHIAHAFALSY